MLPALCGPVPLWAESLRWRRYDERQQCLRFVAAVSVSCSGDKSDKEESAGRFAMLWGFCVTAAVVDWQSVRLNDDSQRKYVDFPEMT